MAFHQTRRCAAPALALAVALAAAAAGAADRGEGYEQPAALRAEDLLPEELLRGPHHAVEQEVRTDGFVPVYTVSSEFGRYEARGEEGVRARIREIEALALLRESEDSEAFARAAERAGQRPEGGGEPVAVAGLPVGAVPAGGESGGRRVLDVEAMRRRIAAELGIDPYTSNEVLRKELDRHAWVAAAGGMTSLLVPDAGIAQAREAAKARPESSPRVGELMRDWSSEDLERLNRIELAAMGVGPPLREEFLKHPSYSPRTGTVLIEALSALEGTEDRAAFIRAAVGARSEEEAKSFQRMAELIRRYGEDSGRLAKITTVDGQVAAFAADGTLVVPVLADHAIWTQRVANFTESMARAAGSDPSVVKTRFVVSGSVSSRARDEMKGRGIDVQESGAGGN